jgi:serpin B
MRIAGSIAILTALLLPSVACTREVVVSEEGDLEELVGGNTGFALEMYGRLAGEETEGNVFFSPYSISSALGMTWAGARGETAGQMARALGFSLPPERLHAAFAGLLEKLGPDYRRSLAGDGAEPLTLVTANAIWIERSYPLLDDYVELVESRYGAAAMSSDFVGDPEGSRTAINDWVSETTRERITDLIPPGLVDEATRVVLTNAVYFKGSWQNQFDKHETRDADFTTLDGSVVQVPMMHQTEYFRYAATSGCTAVALPYSDGMSSMLLLLPDGDLEEFEQGLDAGRLDSILAAMEGGDVSLAMPGFEFTCSFSLRDVLVEMGMTDAFSGSADFSGMTGDRDLLISAVIHKAFVKVDENGTEAAAATAVLMALGCAAPPPVPVEIVLDRPFLFLVRDDITGTILFMGRVADPRG